MKYRFSVPHKDTLLPFLYKSLPQVMQTHIKTQCKKGEVRVNGIKTTQNAPLEQGDTVEIFLPAGFDAPIIKIVYEDETILIADKPPHIESERQLPAAIEKRYGVKTTAVHRLDANTTGILVLAKTAAAHDALVNAFAAGQVHKTYVARVFGCPKEQSGEWRAYLSKNAKTAYCTVTNAPQKDSREIITRFEVAERGDRSLLVLHPVTGRTHQLRAHTAFMGVPIVGDDKYGDRDKNRAAGAKRQMLRAVAIAFGELAYPLRHLCGKSFAVEAGEELAQDVQIELTYTRE